MKICCLEKTQFSQIKTKMGVSDICGGYKDAQCSYLFSCRDPSEQDSHHGQAGAGPLHAVPAGDREGGAGGGHK